MNKEQLLMDQMKKISAQIMQAKIEGKSQLKLRQQFAKLQKEHKAIWLRNFKKEMI